jgi:hypothetical protein
MKIKLLILSIIILPIVSLNPLNPTKTPNIFFMSWALNTSMSLPKTNKFPQSVVINENITIKQFPFNDGDIVYIESTAVGRAYLWSKPEDCKTKQLGLTCGEAKGFYGINKGSRYILRKTPCNVYCLELAASRGVFLYLKDVKDCRAGDNECGSATNIVGNMCRPLFAFNILTMSRKDVDGDFTFFVLQSFINDRVLLRFVARDCADQIGERSAKLHECGGVKGIYLENVDIRRGDYEAFKMTLAS